MSTFLKIENRAAVLPSIEYLRMLGASSSRGDAHKIGQFGSGFPYSLALLARHGLLSGTKLCLGKDVYTFSVVEHAVKDSCGNPAVQHEIVMKKQNSGTTNLNISTSFGELDWGDVTMAAREFICNAIDGSRSIDGTDKHAAVTVVDGASCRADKKTIRVYIPMDSCLEKYHMNIGKNIICLNKWYSKDKVLIPNPRRENVRVYRRGVLVGEFGKGLFHYNLDNIKLNECRIVDESNAKNECARTLAFKAKAEDLAVYLESLPDANWSDPDIWEHSFYNYYMRLSANYTINAEEKTKVKAEWQKAAKAALVNPIVCSNEHEEKVLKSKGFNALRVSTELKAALVETGMKQATDVLNDNDMNGLIIREASLALKNKLSNAWRILKSLDMTAGKSIPDIKVFVQVSEAAGTMRGYYKDKCVYVKEDHANDEGLEIQHIILHELVHHITDADDYTVDFQEYAIKLACRLMSLS